MSLINALQNYLVVTAAIATVVGAVRFLDGRRLKIAVRGASEVTYDGGWRRDELSPYLLQPLGDHLGAGVDADEVGSPGRRGWRGRVM